MSTNSEMRRSGKANRPEKLGRSAATGQFVLKPASKGGSISIREAMQAAEKVINTGKIGGKSK